jgi:hypothetical protein
MSELKKVDGWGRVVLPYPGESGMHVFHSGPFMPCDDVAGGETA